MYGHMWCAAVEIMGDGKIFVELHEYIYFTLVFDEDTDKLVHMKFNVLVVSLTDFVLVQQCES